MCSHECNVWRTFLSQVKRCPSVVYSLLAIMTTKGGLLSSCALYTAMYPTPTECDTFVTARRHTQMPHVTTLIYYWVWHFCNAKLYPAPTECDTSVTAWTHSQMPLVTTLVYSDPRKLRDLESRCGYPNTSNKTKSTGAEHGKLVNYTKSKCFLHNFLPLQLHRILGVRVCETLLFSVYSLDA
jgi:hypothetical protein